VVPFLLLGVACLIPGCIVGGKANLEVHASVALLSAQSDAPSVFCSGGMTVASIEYVVWNGGPSIAQDIKVSLLATAGSEYGGQKTGTDSGTTIPSLPVDSTHRYSDFADIHPGCNNQTVGYRERYLVEVEVKPANGPSQSSFAVVDCTWTSYKYVAGTYCAKS
jgi:hypothetical protein